MPAWRTLPLKALSTAQEDGRYRNHIGSKTSRAASRDVYKLAACSSSIWPYTESPELRRQLTRAEIEPLRFTPPSEADQLRDAHNSRALPRPQPSAPSPRATVTVQLTVTKVDTRSCGTTMFSTDCPEWFEAHDAIGYKAEPVRTPIVAGQVRRVGHCKIDYLILLTPAADDRVVVGRADGPDSNPVLLERPAVEAAQVVSL